MLQNLITYSYSIQIIQISVYIIIRNYIICLKKEIPHNYREDFL